MTFHKGLGILALGIVSYALYKTGAVSTVAKAAVNAGSKASDWTSEKFNKIKECDCFKKEDAPEKVTEEVINVAEKPV